MRAGTIIASNYLEMARLLARSFLRHHPDEPFTILLVDDRPVDEPLDDRIEIVRLDDVGLDAADIDMMRSIYDVMELSTAVKPSFLQFLLRADDIACYVDPDIFVYTSISDLVEPARDVGIVLTPHVLQPIPRDGCHPTERAIMQSGVMNLGFIAVGRTATDFLTWWHERLLVDAVSAVDLNLFTDQRWVDWVPALFDHVVCRDPGMNIAWWNIHERHLDLTDDGPTANGAPVRFVHFSGYVPASPDVLSKHQPDPARTQHSPGSVIRRLAEEYGEQLVASGHDSRVALPYQFGVTTDGVVLTAAARGAIRRGLLNGKGTGSEAVGLDPSVPLAFGSSSSALRDWLLAPDSEQHDLPRVAVALWHQRSDLRAAFPDLAGDDAQRYRAWLAHDPGAEQSLPGLVDVRPAPLTAAPTPGTVSLTRGFLGRLKRRVTVRR